MSEPNHIESLPAEDSASAVPVSTGEQQQVTTIRPLIQTPRHRRSSASPQPAAKRPIHRYVGISVALVASGIVALVFYFNYAEKDQQRRQDEHVMWTQRFALAQLHEDTESALSQLHEAERMVKALTILSKTAPMEFTFLRRFGDPADHTYEAVLNGNSPCVLRVSDERLILTRGFGLKYFTGKAISMGEKPYRTNGGDRKYSDTYDAVESDVDAQLAKAQKELDDLTVKHADLRKRLNAETAKSSTTP